MPVVAIPLDELFGYLGRELPPEELELQLHRFGSSVEGWATARRWRCPSCGALSESGEGEELAPPACDGCGADLRDPARHATPAGDVRVLRMELLAVRPDLFDPAGLARGLAGFLGDVAGSPRYELERGPLTLTVDPGVAGPDTYRPRIVAATVHGLKFDDAKLRSLMKLQENVHWALGRDRKLAAIGVHDFSKVTGTAFRYRAAAKQGGVRFTPLGFDTSDPSQALDPAEILARHPKGKAFARLLEKGSKVPVLEDEKGNVLSMPPIINGELTRVTLDTTDVLVDVTGLEDRHIDRALNIVVTSLLEACPGSSARSVEVRYADGARITPDFAPQEVVIDPAAAGRLIGVPWTPDEVLDLLRRMRHEARREGDKIRVFVPAWRADILHPRDLFEDVAIAYGYDRLPAVQLTSATYGKPDPREERQALARRALVGQGFLEVMTLSLVSAEAARRGADGAEPVTIENPVTQDQAVVRTSLLPGLLDTLAVNLGHTYPQRLCEVGVACFVDPTTPTGGGEKLLAALAIAGDGQGYAVGRSALDQFLAEMGVPAGAAVYAPSSSDLFLPGRGAEVRIGGRTVARLGEVHPAVLERLKFVHPVVVAEVEIDALGQ